MSDWLNAAREVHQAGGRLAVSRMWSAPEALHQARKLGVIEWGHQGGRARHWAVLTPRGRDLVEGRVQKVDARRGAPWRATWLMALPRANEIRLGG